MTSVPGVVAGVDDGQLPEGGVVRAGAVLGGGGGAALVKGVVRHQVSAMHVG